MNELLQFPRRFERTAALLLVSLLGGCTTGGEAQAQRFGPSSDASIGSEEVSFNALRTRILDDARASLEALNLDYLNGRLSSDHLLCVNDSFPVTDYHCDDGAGRNMDFGVAWTLAYHRTEQCQARLVNAGDGSACSTQYVELGYATGWHAMYASHSRGGADVESLQIGEQLETGAGIDGVAGYCEISLSAAGKIDVERADLCLEAAHDIVAHEPG